MAVRSIVTLIVLLVVTPVSWANESLSLEENVRKYIQDLDSNSFAERNSATRQLERMGPAIFPALEEAATSGNREVTSRAIEVLRSWYDQESTTEKESARAALERISKSEHPTASRMAKNVINPPATGRAVPGIAGRQIIVNNQVRNVIPMQFAPRIQIQQRIAPAGGNFRKVSSKFSNGRRETTIEENDRKVKVVQEKDGKVTVEITTKEGGKEKTEKYEAKNLEELKKKHPDAAKEVERTSFNRVLQIGAKPAAAPQQQAKERFKQHRERIKKQLEKLDPNNPGHKRIIEAFEKQIKALEKQAS